MAQIPLMVEGEEGKPDPEVSVAQCCSGQTGLLVGMGDAWWLLRDAPDPGGRLMTRAFRVAACRGCYRDPSDPGIKKKPWTFGRDEQLDEHLRKLARETGK